MIRHTTPNVEKGVIYGQLDIDVTDSFKEEVVGIQKQLPDQIDAFYSSPLQRCTKLNQVLSDSFYIDERLMEVNFGDWEGKTWESVPRKELDTWMTNYVTAAPPSGESMEQMFERVQAFWSELQNSTHTTVAVITHAGVIRLITAIVESKDLKDVFDLKLQYGQVIRIIS